MTRAVVAILLSALATACGGPESSVVVSTSTPAADVTAPPTPVPASPTPPPAATTRAGLPVRADTGTWYDAKAAEVVRGGTYCFEERFTPHGPLLTFSRFAGRSATLWIAAAVSVTIDQRSPVSSGCQWPPGREYRTGLGCVLTDPFRRVAEAGQYPTFFDEGFYTLLAEVLEVRAAPSSQFSGGQVESLPATFTTVLVFNAHALTNPYPTSLTVRCGWGDYNTRGSAVRTYGHDEIVAWTPPPPYNQ